MFLVLGQPAFQVFQGSMAEAEIIVSHVRRGEARPALPAFAALAAVLALAVPGLRRRNRRQHHLRDRLDKLQTEREPLQLPRRCRRRRGIRGKTLIRSAD
jgi:hypothetical protein